MNPAHVDVKKTMRVTAGRVPTLFFLQAARQTAHIYLTSEIDCSRFLERKAELSRSGSPKIGHVALFTQLVAPVLNRFPVSKQVLREGIRPTIAEYEGLPIKILMNQKHGNDQNVMAVVIPRAESCSAAEVQALLDEAKAHGHGSAKGARLKRLLGHLPMPLAALLSRKILQDFKKRGALQGSVAISSLGHARVDTFLPQIFGSLGFGLGTISRRAAVIHDRIEIRPMMTLAMVFDHRIMDGAIAAEILAEIKSILES